MRRWCGLPLLMAAVAVVLCSCAPLVEDVEPERQIYATFYPFYALSSLLIQEEDNLHLSCLVQPQDGCLRDYALSDWDLYLLSQADLVIAGGRGLESFEAALQSMGDDGPAVVFTLYNTQLYNQDDATSTDEENSHLDGANPHLYMSIDGAKYIVESVALALMELFPEQYEAFLAAMDAADARLDELFAQMSEIASNAQGRSAILMNEALVYIAQDLGVEIAGQYDRESGQELYESEVEECLEALGAMDASVVLVERQAPASVVNALESAGYLVAKIDVFSTGRADMGADGYFDGQIENARAISKAFALAEEMN